MKFRKIYIALLLITLCATSAYALGFGLGRRKAPKPSRFSQIRQLTPEQSALIDKAIGREKVLIKNIQQRTPLVETYIQTTKLDIKLYQVPVSDEYMLSRVDFGKVFFDKSYEPRINKAKSKHKFFKGSLPPLPD